MMEGGKAQEERSAAAKQSALLFVPVHGNECSSIRGKKKGPRRAEGDGTMTGDELYRVYCAWEPGMYRRSRAQLFHATELMHVTLEESERGFVDRLYRAASKYEDGRLGLFVFYEENVFRDGSSANGEAELVSTGYFVQRAD